MFLVFDSKDKNLLIPAAAAGLLSFDVLQPLYIKLPLKPKDLYYYYIGLLVLVF